MRVEDVRVDKKEKQPIKAVPPNTIVGADEAIRPLGLLASKAKESPDCWDRCEETEQLFYGAVPIRG